MPEDNSVSALTLDVEQIFRVVEGDSTVGIPMGFSNTVFRVLARMLRALGIHEAAKLMRPPPEGCKYVVQIVRKFEDDHG